MARIYGLITLEIKDPGRSIPFKKVFWGFFDVGNDKYIGEEEEAVKIARPNDE